MKDKEVIEKTLINQRAGFETRNVDVRELLHNSNPDSTLYVTENERFDKDFAIHDKKRRMEEQYKKDLAMEKQRLERLNRDAQRWEEMAQQEAREDARMAYKTEVFKVGKKNTSGMPYNPITLEYENSDKGQELKVKDEKSQVRAYLRANNLDSRSNCGYDILTGEVRRPVELKEDIKGKYDNMIVGAMTQNPAPKRKNNIW
eukprot:CAMPEP_0176436966 /NCGR_PEP_ID=MMETSP0127-20121128/18318_1 /TAXON_ID=938130 /ORGANISM="Platyophrya macrostoma, Strain WH" /LENGTH=201 /DNA_ID=CAMNT_0017820457 /DNA_START=71 /DNA_END=676 /DNA_ORIENTATION=-